MGWTTYIADFYKNGSVDAKAEMDRHYTWETEKRTNKVIKSAMVGSVYYCAVETIDKENGERRVWAGIAKTSKDTRDGMNFGYKDMDETAGPYCYDCPKSIMDLLTSTENEYAKEWRRKVEEKRTQPKLTDVKVGESIIWTMQNGTERRLTKMNPNYQFKRTWWYCPDANTYVSSKRIEKWRKENC